MKTLIAALALFLIQLQADKPASIEGVVVNAGTGEPVRLAAVEASRSGESAANRFTAATDSEGRFVLKNLPPGEYRLAATHAGFVRSEYRQRSVDGFPGLGAAIKLASGQTFTNAGISLTETGAVYGHVTNSVGVPTPSMSVSAMRWEYLNGRLSLARVKETTTNDLGEYRLFWLPPGSYFLSVTPGEPVWLRKDASNLEMIVAGSQILLPEEQPSFPFYFPGTTELSASKAITLRPGDNLGGMDIEVSPLKYSTIRGVVKMPAPSNGKIAIAVRLQMTYLTGFGSPDTGLNAIADPLTGIFEIRRVIPGSYFLVAEHTSDRAGGNRSWRASAAIEVGNRDLENVALSLSEKMDIPLRVLIDGLPASELEMESLWLVMQEGSDNGTAGPVEPFSPGAMILKSVWPGDHRIENWSGGFGENRNLYLKSVRLAGADATQQLHLERRPNDPIEVELSTHGGSITGIVTNAKGEPEVNVTVLVAPDASLRKDWELFRTARTDSDGKFQIRGLAPGNHSVFAWEKLESGAYLDPKFMSDNEALGKLVHIEEDDALNLQLRAVTPMRQ